MPNRPIALAVALCCATAPVAAQEASARPTLWDVFSVRNLATSLANSLMSSARAFADIRYDQISVDPLAARIDFVDLRVDPLLPDSAGECHVTAALATLRGGSLDHVDKARLSLVLDDMRMSSGCLPPGVGPMVRGLGFDTVTARRVEATLNYDYPSGGGELIVSAEVADLAALQLHADVDYISYRMDPDSGDPAIAIDLNAADLAVTDLGGWKIVQNFLPEAMKVPDALAKAVADGVRNALRDANGFIDPTLSPAQDAFADQIGQQVAQLGDGAAQIVVSTDIAKAPLRIDAAATQDFPATFDALSPIVGGRPPALAQVIPAQTLKAALQSGKTPDDALALGRALITGVGAPLNVTEGLRLLAPLADDGNVEALALAASALEQRDPALAYGYALRASAGGAQGMLALLDRLEPDLGFDAMIAAQDGANDTPPKAATYGNPRAMRDVMRAYLLGIGHARSYEAAYYWALLGAAAGDPAAAAQRVDIDERMRLRGDADAWAEVAARLETKALNDWIDADVPLALQHGR